MRGSRGHLAGVAAVLLALPFAAHAQTTAAGLNGDAATAVRQLTIGTAGAIRIDGFVTPEEWAGAQLAEEFVQQRPVAGSPASLVTDVRILRDDDAIYVGARLHDPRPDSIVARLARRDATVDSDWFFVFFDTFRDRRNAFGFGVNAAGVKRDVRVSEDTREDASWDAVWEAVARRDAGGWSVEMRIPLSQLRYVPGSTMQAWGVNFRREVARTDEVATWSPSPQGSSRFVSDFGELRIAGPLPIKRDIEIVPYVVSRAEHAPGAEDDPWRGQVTGSWSTGADLTMGLGGGLTLAATVNPEFGQVDADPSQLNLSAFETFLSERRPFFVEGAEIFQLTFPSFPRLFHSRRIGRSPQLGLPSDAAFAEPVTSTRILAAAKVSGRTEDGWTIGVLDAVTREESRSFARDDGTRGGVAVEPLSNYAVTRVARAFNEDRSSLGALVTAVHRDVDEPRMHTLHSSAWTGAIDGRHLFAGGDLEFAGSIVGSHVRGDTLALQRTQRAAGHRFQRPDADYVEYDPHATSLSGAGATLRLRTLGTSKWRFFVESWARSPGLELGDLGFQFEDGADAFGGFGEVAYRNLQPSGIFRRWSVFASTHANATFGGDLWSAGGGLHFDAQFSNLWTLFLNVGGQLPTLSHEALRGGPGLRQEGRRGVFAELATDPRRAVSIGIAANRYHRVGVPGENWFVDPSITFRPSASTSAQVTGSISHGLTPAQYVTRITAADGPAYVMAELEQRVRSLSLRMDHTFTPTLSLQLWLQPFLASGRYSVYREVIAPRAARFDARFRTFDSSEVRVDADAGTVGIDRDSDGQSDLSFDIPDFRVRELRSNLVLRWEYRPGSTAWLVWGHDRSSGLQGADFSMRRELDALLETPASNRVMFKLSYRVGG